MPPVRSAWRDAQGRHPLQTSDALGAAAHQIGPQALALTATLPTALGVPYAKIARLFTTAFGLTISRSTLCRALTRLATRAGPTYTALTAQVRERSRVSLDDTGWTVAAQLEWLWVAVTVATTMMGSCWEAARVHTRPTTVGAFRVVSERDLRESRDLADRWRRSTVMPASLKNST